MGVIDQMNDITFKEIIQFIKDIENTFKHFGFVKVCAGCKKLKENCLSDSKAWECYSKDCIWIEKENVRN